MKKIYIFKTTRESKAFLGKVKILPYVTYCNDYCSRSRIHAIVEGDIDEEREKELDAICSSLQGKSTTTAR